MKDKFYSVPVRVRASDYRLCSSDCKWKAKGILYCDLWEDWLVPPWHRTKECLLEAQEDE